MIKETTNDWKAVTRVPYALRHVPDESISCLLPCADSPQAGDIALAVVEKLGRNANLELRDGRRCSLQPDSVLAVVFGNRYATNQFEGYARANGDRCDLLSMGGVCGLVESKHTTCGEPTKLRLLGFIGDSGGRRLQLRQFAHPPVSLNGKPPVKVVVVCGSSMDAGKTYTAMSVIAGLKKERYAVVGAKLTGTATGRDRFQMLDAGAHVALDFVDGGFPSTYLCNLEDLMNLYNFFLATAASYQAACLVVEIADGLLQNETAALLQSARFCETVDAWIFAAGDPLAAAAGVRVLRGWGITPIAISGVVSMSLLGIREAQIACGLPCLTARELQAGELNDRIVTGAMPVPARPAGETGVDRVSAD
jgi:hypothetical protein